ncbi:MAG: hypothetical protein JW801_18115 [Bacteroidales bacterium]|nr:hypothetical protein [Bacteroidales bacterium]
MKKTGFLLITMLSIAGISFAQTDDQLQEKLDKFFMENTKRSIKQISSDTLLQVLKHDVYLITLTSWNMFDETVSDDDQYIVVDTGDKFQTFEMNNTNTKMPGFLSWIKEDFVLNEKTAPLFQGMLDLTYPIEEWKADKKEFLMKDGKWYFLRDTFFSSKQGFEITIDATGRITGIRYKMRWEE